MSTDTERLTRWKAEALEVLKAWEKAWEAAGSPGEIGTSKAAETLAAVERLRTERDEARAAHAALLADVEELRAYWDDPDSNLSHGWDYADQIAAVIAKHAPKEAERPLACSACSGNAIWPQITPDLCPDHRADFESEAER